jgi:hypothetical protein
MFNLISRLMRSLLLTTAFTFSVPLVLIGSILGFLVLIRELPGCCWLAETGATQILEFLSVFGSGYPMQGILWISLTFAFVGCLFDLFNFYRYQTLSGH